MAIAHTPLDPSTFSPAAQRALAPGPAQMMAARGLVPLPRPGELVSVLYQLACHPAADPGVREAASASVRGLPERVLAGALADDGVDARVLDFIAPLAAGKPALVQALVLNRATADETIAALAATCGVQGADLIAQNEQRLLRYPAIVGALYHNRQARMSTVDRALELAVRSGVTVPDIPGWEGIVGAIMGTIRDPNAGRAPAEADAIFAQATALAEQAQGQAGPAAVLAEEGGDDEDLDIDAGDYAEPPQQQAAPASPAEANVNVPIQLMTVPQKIRLATLGNAFSRAVLVRDPNRVVATAAVKAPGVSEMEIAKYAGNHSLNDDVIKYIVGRREWTRSYHIKAALAGNPKTPIADAIRFMPSLRERELRALARSKGVPSAVAAQARKLLMARTRTGPQQKK